MNWCSVFPKISYFREGMGNRTKPLLLAGCVILQLGEIRFRYLETTGPCAHVCKCVQARDRRAKTKPPVLSAVYQRN